MADLQVPARLVPPDDDPESPDSIDPVNVDPANVDLDSIAAGITQHAGPDESAPRSRRKPTERAWARPRTTRRLLVVGLVLVAAVGFLLYKGLTSALVYFKTANEAVADRSQLGNTSFQLEGVVVKGSVRQLGEGKVAFTIIGGGASIPIVNNGEPPELFRGGIPVVVFGHFVGSTLDFSSNQVLVKHSNQYIAAHPSRVTVPASDATAKS